MTMPYTVSATDLAHLRFQETDLVASVLQNIAIILATPKGSVPNYREFGLDNSFLDKPMPVAKVLMIAPVREAIETWEPRATVLSVTATEDLSNPGKLSPVVVVEIEGEGETT